MSDTFAHAALWIAAAVFDSIWEGALIAGTVWFGLRCLPKLGAATRYAIWLSALAGIVLIPVLTAGLSERPRDPLVGAAATSAESAVTIVAPAAQPQAGMTRVVQNPAEVVHGATPAAAPRKSQIPIPEGAALAAAIIWLLAVCTRGLLLVLDVRDLAAIRRNARPWSTAYDYPVFVSDRVRVPLAAGFLRPAVILPAPLLEQLDAEAVETIIIHEVAHLRRRDVWTNAVARIAHAFVVLNPAAWFVMRRLSMEREIACDDWVVARTGTGDTFARTLLTLASDASVHVPFAAASAFGSRHSVVVRIERLLDSRPRRLRLSRPALGAALTVLALIALVMQSVSPVLAYAPQRATTAGGSTTARPPGDCVTPNRSIRMTSFLGMKLIRRLPGYHEAVLELPEARSVVARYGAANAATLDLSVDAAGKPRKVVVLSAPPFAGMAEHITRIFMTETYAPALHGCVPVAATIRTAVHVEAPRENVYSIVVPEYPKGWSAHHATACKVPTLQHSGVPALPDAMKDMSVEASYSASVRVHVDAAGAVTKAAVVMTSGQRSIDDALLTAARHATYPLTESTGFKQARPSGASLAWNAAHGSATYVSCTPQPTDYVWNTTFGRIVPIGPPGAMFVVLARRPGG